MKKKKNKRAFTLIELLAVIAILAILAIMALPNVLRLLNNARKESFTTEVRTIVGSAEKQWLSDQITNPKSEITYARVNGNKCDDNPMLDLSGNKNLNYKVTVENGKVKCIQLDNGKYSYTLTSNDGIDTSQIENSKVTDVNENNKVTCEEEKKPPVNKCTYNGELVHGAEYVNRQYTYMYKQDGTSTRWKNTTSDG